MSDIDKNIIMIPALPPEEEDKLRRSMVRIAIDLDRNKPFFGYLYRHLRYIIDYTLPAAMGVSGDGDLFVNPFYIKQLGWNERQIEAVMCHEILHVATRTLDRQQGRLKELWNEATDVAINSLLNSSQEFELPDNILVPNRWDSYTALNGAVVSDCSTKCAEQIYSELIKNQQEKKKNNNCGSSNKDNQAQAETHERWSTETGGASSAKTQSQAKVWQERMAVAAEIAKQRGRLPSAIARLVNALLEPVTDWRDQFRYCLEEGMSNDTTWRRPNRKQLVRRMYLPGPNKKSVDVLAHIETSGSIRKEDLTDFVSELAGMFTGDIEVKITVLVGDSEIHQIFECTNQAELIDCLSLGLKGGGGTSHKPVVQWLLEHKPAAKLLVSLTDGYSDIQECYDQIPETCRKLLILTSSEMQEKLESYVDDIIVIDR